jgi:TPR repeat protein
MKGTVLRRLLASVLLGLLFQGAVPAVADEEPAPFYKGVQAYRARDYEAAASWFLQAAEQGDSEAQFLLGRMHYDGNSLPPDYVAAYQWFAIAAETGLPVAARYRDGLAGRMTEAEVTEGTRRAADWLSQHPPAPRPDRN